MTPKVRYQADLRKAGFHTDPAQAAVVEHIQRLYIDLLERAPGDSWFDRWLDRGRGAPRGLYIWGGPGRGKTYLVDSFYDCLPFPEKRRMHFHQFMLVIHQRLGELPKTPNPLVVLAAQLAREVRVLCLDEFHVYDIADAMLLDGLLKAMLERGITLVATSNIEPDRLYRDGLQRDRFLPAIERLKQHTDVVRLGEGSDFRQERLERGGTYRVGQDDAAAGWLEDHLVQLDARDVHRDTLLRVNGRDIASPALAEGIAWFRFPALCMEPRSARDYLELARLFHTILLEDVPQFGEYQDEPARRFIHLIDALYDHQVKLVLTAAAEPGDLYTGGRLAELFERTASRLMEMRTRRYLALPHRGRP